MKAILDDYIDRPTLAKELGLTTRTLDKWAVARFGPPKIKIGAKVYYHRQDVADWLEKQRESAK